MITVKKNTQKCLRINQLNGKKKIKSLEMVYSVEWKKKSRAVISISEIVGHFFVLSLFK